MFALYVYSQYYYLALSFVQYSFNEIGDNV